MLAPELRWVTAFTYHLMSPMKPNFFIRKSMPWIPFLAVTFASATLLTATPSALPTGDHEIASFVELDINLDQRDAGLSLQVKMNDGIAILTGEAGSLGEAERAATRAVSTAGVRAVVNAVTVKTAPAAAVNEGIRQTLGTQRMMDAANVAFSVAEGRVFLTGSVASAGDRELARDLVATIHGVSWVESDLQVRGGMAREDSQIAEHVKFLIRQDPAFQGLDLAVTVRSGSVGISGEVGSGDELGRLMRLCRVEGVSGFRTSSLSVNTDLAMEAFEEKDYGKEQAVGALAAALEADPRVQAESVRLKLDDKEMILSGRVHSFAARDAADADARAIPGVLSVRNELSVGTGEFSHITPGSPQLVMRER